ncbi:uncharacterized protein si:ch211-113e8.11 [Synchiropus splendidus]|uniref:uncharacterized protein si:ch211-113e8.11 n=1 Tax=Synchiropus splendidus TaxID=270530 RepID=UPI00237E60C1|nr:uncharacterized protein si:ch211-113e8.11 [Synchiropus splendidus]
MNSLVGYGVSSDSDSDAEERGETLEPDGSPLKRSRNFLLESGSSESDGDADPGADLDPLKRCPSPQHPGLAARFQGAVHQNKLPPPALNASSGSSSVFANPFKAQAEQKLSALQKHVPLTLQSKPSQIGGKKMCVSYRRDGRCRFGIKCKFAHDSDLQTALTASDGRSSLSNETPPQAVSGEGGGSEETEEDAQRAKKRKAGLSNTLIPPKRAMKQLAMQRDRERLHWS